MRKYILFILFSSLLILGSCLELEQDITVDIPVASSETIVEFYLEPNRPFRLLLTETGNFFEDPIPPLVTDAQIRITYQGGVELLNLEAVVDTNVFRFYNYSSSALVTFDTLEDYTLEIIRGNQQITARTRFLPKPRIKEITPTFREDSMAFLLTRFFDNDPDKENFYRFTTTRDSLGGRPEDDFEFQDVITDDGEIVVGTGFGYEKGDTVVLTLYHIDEDFHDFLETSQEAANANGNPFAQPAFIRSNVEGAIGIFTALSFERRTFIIREDSLEYLEIVR